MKNLLSRSGESAQSSPVKGIHQRNYIVPSPAVFVKAVFSCKLNSAFVRLSARISEKHLRISGCLTQLFSKISLNLCIIVIGRVLNWPYLSADRVRPTTVAEAEGICTDTAAEIDIFFPVFINTASFISFFKRYSESAVCIHNIIVEFFNSIH